MEFTIRLEEAKDIEQVREIVRAAFPTAAESQLVDALRAKGKAVISLVAVSFENNPARYIGYTQNMKPRGGLNDNLFQL